MDDKQDCTLLIDGWLVSASSYADDPSKISIYRTDAAGDVVDGGDFDRADFVAHLAKFYKDRF